MDSQTVPDEWPITICVGYHDTERNDPVTGDQLNQAWDCNYNMLTAFITNQHFHTRIETLIAEYRSRDVVPVVSSLTDLDTLLEPSSLATSTLAFTSPWIDVCSPDPLIAGISKQVLCMEVAFAAFCGFEQVMIQGPRLYHRDSLHGEDVLTGNIMQYARAVQDSLATGMRLQISILLPFDEDQVVDGKHSDLLHTREDYLDADLAPRSNSVDSLASWDTWNTIRTFCKYHSRLTVALEMPRHLPKAHVQSRWFSEPVKALMLSQSSFTLNAKGYPTLQSSVQSFLKPMMRLKVAPWIILEDVGAPPGPNAQGEIQCADGDLPDEAVLSAVSNSPPVRESQHSDTDQLAHLNYIRHLERMQEPRSDVEREGAGYQDYLQVPLQPLTDNLESMTYEVFEKDPVKYDLYEQAVRKALRDWSDQHKPTSGLHGKVVVVVAGAGRGPLVTRALKASAAENVPIDMWAIEKNPNAFVLLRRHNRRQWKGQVSLEQSDMRSWKGPWRDDYSPTPAEASKRTATPPEVAPSRAYYSIDILISELLGSFGDNELSPECLDGILHLLATPHGISIPQSYTAWLTPISAPKLHADIYQRTAYDSTAPETPAVVWLHQIDYLSREIISQDHDTHKASPGTPEGADSSNSRTSHPYSIKISLPKVSCAWNFRHGSTANESDTGIATSNNAVTAGSNSHNGRFSKLTFRTRHRGVCHGLGGYFESVLYPGVELSTNPNTINDKSKNMMSWFPIFFPLKTPLFVPSASTLDVSIWRQTDGRKVWYEWMIESWGWNLMQPGARGVAGGNHEKKGNEEGLQRRPVRLDMTELHSSIKNACLM